MGVESLGAFTLRVVEAVLDTVAALSTMVVFNLNDNPSCVQLEMENSPP